MLELRICYSTACSVRSAVKKEMLMQPSFCYNWPIFRDKVKKKFQSWHITGIVFLNPTTTAVRILLRLQRHRHGSLTLHCIDSLRISPWWKFRFKLSFIHFLVLVLLKLFGFIMTWQQYSQFKSIALAHCSTVGTI